MTQAVGIGRRPLLMVVVSANFIIAAFGLSLSPMLPEAMRTFNTGVATLAWAGGAYGLATALAATAGAPAQDRFAPFNVIGGGIGLHCLGLLLVWRSGSWILFVTGYLVCGLAVGVLYPALVSAIAAQSPVSGRGPLIARSSLGWALSFLLGVPLATAITALGNWRMIPLSFLILWGLVLGVLWRTRCALKSEVRADRAISSGPSGLNVEVPRHLSIFACTFCGFAAFYGLYSLLGLAVYDHGLGLAYAGQLTAAFGLGFLIASRLGLVLERCSAPATLLGPLALVASITAAIPLSLARSYGVTMLLMVIWGVAHILFFTAATTILSGFDAGRRGRFLSFNQAAISVGVAAGPILCSNIYVVSDYRFVGLACSVAALLALLFGYIGVESGADVRLKAQTEDLEDG